MLEGSRETVLGIGEKLEFNPMLCNAIGKYYAICQYKQVYSQNDEIWAQTWLPFKLSRASREGEVYIKPSELEFKCVIPMKGKVIIFSEKPKGTGYRY